MAGRFETRGPPSKRGRMESYGRGGRGRGSRYGGRVEEYRGDNVGSTMSPEEVEMELTRAGLDVRPNNIILLTVLNAQYPINVSIINKVCSPLGKVLRIVVFKKGHLVQSMVEFEDIGTASTVKNNLHGCDIYSGFCTLKVEFAKTDRLNVKRNDENTWDYTQEFAMSQGHQDGKFLGGDDMRDRPVLLDEPPPSGFGGVGSVAFQLGQGVDIGMGNNSGMVSMGYTGGFGDGPSLQIRGGPLGHFDGNFGGETFNDTRASGGFNEIRGGNGFRVPRSFDVDLRRGRNSDMRGDQGYRGSASSTSYDEGPGLTGNGAPGGGNAVCMIYGLDPDKFNCQRVFNLFCQYGNIRKVMFLKNKDGTAMVQLDYPESVDSAIHNLEKNYIFKRKIYLEWSMKAYIDEVRNPHELPDGSSSYQDFTRDRNNRFDTPERAAKNRIIAPTKILHFFNIPKMDDDELETTFTDSDAPAPKKIKWFPMKGTRSVSGLCEFDSVQEACEALVIVNHKMVEGEDKKFPFCMKLCFSPATH